MDPLGKDEICLSSSYMKGADVVDNVSDRMWQNDVLAQTFEGVLYQLMGHDVPTEILNSN